jgi:preprotein translocase subunit SecA
MSDVREGIHFRTYGQQDPLFEFQKVGIELFDRLPGDIEDAAVGAFEALSLEQFAGGLSDSDLRAPTSTWTYTVSDNPWEDTVRREHIGGGGIVMNAWAGLRWPLTALLVLAERRRKRKRER